MKISRFSAIHVGLFGLAVCAGWGTVGLIRPSSPAEGSTFGKTLPPSGRAGHSPQNRAVDPRFAAVAEAGDPAEQIQAALDLAAALDPAEFERMLAELNNLPLSAQWPFEGAILRRWVALNPMAALDWWGKFREFNAPAVVSAWTELDPKAAEAYFRSPPLGWHSYWFETFFRTLSQKDPDAAFAALASPDFRKQHLHHFRFDTLASVDPQRLLAAAPGLPPMLAGMARREAAKVLARRDFPAAVAWAREQPDSNLLFEEVVGAAPNPRVALAEILKETSSSVRDRSFYALDSLAYRDPGGMLAAFSALNGFPTDQGSRDVVRAAFFRLTQLNAQEAARLATATPWPEAWGTQSQVAREWIKADPAAALAWARTLPEGKIDAQTLRQLEATVEYPPWDPSPLQRTLNALRAGQFRLDALPGLTDPEDRAALLDALAQPGVIPENMGAATVYGIFSNSFPADSAAWLARQPETAERDGKLAEAMTKWGRADPTAAAAWIADTLPAPQRPRAIQSLLPSWQAVDPDGAKAYFHALPDDVRQTVTPPGKDW